MAPRTFSISTEPTDVKRVTTTDSSQKVFTHNGGSMYGSWVDEEDNQYDWIDVLQEFGDVTEVVHPAEAIEFFKRYNGDIMEVYGKGPNGPATEHLRSLIEFAEVMS